MKGVACVLLLFIANSVGAYELSIPCKSADGWKVIRGQCDDRGLLQGMGSATLDPTDGVRPQTMVSGPFKDGLPNGNMELQFGVRWDPRFEVRGSCKLQFANGQVLSSALSCTDYTSKTTVTVKPGAGKIVWAKAPAGPRGGATLTIDLPEVQIDGQFKNSESKLLTPFTTGYGVLGVFTGQADVFVLSTTDGTSILIKNLTGTVSGKEVEISGTFTAKCFDFNGCAINPYRVSRTGGSVDARGLIRVTPAGKQVPYEMVFDTPDRGGGGPVLLYYKDDQIEFDATTTRCGDSAYGAELYGKGKGFDIFPLCGKITARDGRSYEGKFVRGRPAPQ